MTGGTGLTRDPFAVLGLRADDDLSDDDVRIAWRRVAAASHPDRADGGDPDQFALAAAAYTELRTRFGRNEARADLVDRAGAATAVAASAGAAGVGTVDAVVTGQDDLGAPDANWARIVTRVRNGRPGRLLLRLAVAAVAGVIGVFAAGRSSAVAPALVVGTLTWFLVTARHDLG